MPGLQKRFKKLRDHFDAKQDISATDEQKAVHRRSSDMK